MDCIFRTLSSIGLRDTILNQFAFEQPSTVNYKFYTSQSNKLKMKTLSDPKNDKSDQIPAEAFFQDLPQLSLDCYVVHKDCPGHVNMVHIKNANNPTNTVIFYCHGNSSCLGRLFPFIRDIAATAAVDVFALDYHGYGDIKGKPTDTNVIESVQMAYKHLTKELGVQSANIVLYGQSLGGGPVTFLACHPDYPVGGLIVESGFASGLRTMSKNRTQLYYRDFFPSSYYMGFVDCLTFIMQADDDSRMPKENSRILYKASPKNFEPFFPATGEHNDIKIKHHDEYYKRLKEFLGKVKGLRESLGAEEFKKRFRGRLPKKFPHFYCEKFSPDFDVGTAGSDKWPKDLMFDRPVESGEGPGGVNAPLVGQN